jgi:insulysin
MITKADMIEMFQRYVLPSSPERAKLAIHLHAKYASGVSSLAQTTVTLNTVTKVTGVTNIAMESSRKDLYIIGDVRDYKSRLAVTAGPQAVKDLSEFEDIESNQIKSYDAGPADAVECYTEAL